MVAQILKYNCTNAEFIPSFRTDNTLNNDLLLLLKLEHDRRHELKAAKTCFYSALHLPPTLPQVRGGGPIGRVGGMYFTQLKSTVSSFSIFAGSLTPYL